MVDISDLDVMPGPILNRFRELIGYHACSKCERPAMGWKRIFFWRTLHVRRCRIRVIYMLLAKDRGVRS